MTEMPYLKPLRQQGRAARAVIAARMRHCLRGVDTAHFLAAQSEARNADKVRKFVHKVLGRIPQIVIEHRQDSIHPELVLPRFEIRRILAGFGQLRITQNSFLETPRDYAVCALGTSSLIRRGASREAK